MLKCEKQERFIGVTSFQTMYTNFVANVANYAFFGVIFCLKNCGRIIFLINIKSEQLCIVSKIQLLQPSMHRWFA